MAINDLNKDKIITLEGLNTFREKNGLQYIKYEKLGSSSDSLQILIPSQSGGGDKGIAIKLTDVDGVTFLKNVIASEDLTVTGTLNATTLKQNGANVALASQIPSDLNTKLGLITTYDGGAGGWSIGDGSRVLNLVGTQVRINGNLSALDWTVATTDDINAIFS